MSQPFELIVWDGVDQPTESFLLRMLTKENLAPQSEELPMGKTHEMKFEKPVVYTLVSGALYFGFPGYGSVDLKPGDTLEIKPGVLFDITVTGTVSAKLFTAVRL